MKIELPAKDWQIGAWLVATHGKGKNLGGKYVICYKSYDGLVVAGARKIENGWETAFPNDVADALRVWFAKEATKSEMPEGTPTIEQAEEEQYVIAKMIGANAEADDKIFKELKALDAQELKMHDAAVKKAEEANEMFDVEAAKFLTLEAWYTWGWVLDQIEMAKEQVADVQPWLYWATNVSMI